VEIGRRHPGVQDWPREPVYFNRGLEFPCARGVEAYGKTERMCWIVGDVIRR